MQQAQGDTFERRVVCQAAGRLCALPGDQVIEVMRSLPVRPIAAAPSYVAGVSVIRGAPVVVVDVGLLLGDAPTARERLVTVRAGERTVALGVDAVLGMRPIAVDRRGRLPPLLSQAAGDVVASLTMLDGELLFVLRATHVLPEDLHGRLLAEGVAA